MKEQKLETSDATLGVKLKVSSQDKKRYNKVIFNKKFFDVGDVVYLISEQEHQQLTTHQKNIDVNYWKNKLAKKDSEITSLNAKVSELKQSLEQSNKNNESIDKYKQELQSKLDLINDLTTSNKEKDATINQLKARINELGMQLDNSVESSELAVLQQELDSTKKEVNKWKDNFAEISEQNLGILDENESLKKANDKINNTNQLLNANINSLNATFDETKQQLTSDFEKQEQELKETIKNNQSHIDELTDKYQSLLPLQNNIAPKEHYDELGELNDKLNAVQQELDKTNAEIELKLATQKQELNDAHNIEINNIKDEKRKLEVTHTNEKAQLLVAYNENINQHKMKYNELAKDYNYLLNDACSLSRLNTLWSGKHKDIVKDRTPIELEVIPPSEQLATSDNTIEYVPKD